MGSEAEARSAIESLDNNELKGRKLHVEPSRSNDRCGGSHRESGGGNLRDAGPYGDAGGYRERDTGGLDKRKRKNNTNTRPPALITGMASSSKRAKVESGDVTDRFLANVDVWQTIFKMLEVKDRIRLEMTNRRLRALMFTCWKRVTSFDTQCLTGISYNSSMSKSPSEASFDSECLTEMSDDSSMSCDGENLSAALIAICVNRIGDSLRSLTMSETSFPIDLWSATLASIGKGCPNVETINFVIEDKDVTLNVRFDSFSRLKTLIVSTEGEYTISAFASLFLSIPTSIEVIRGLEGYWEEPFENSAQIEGFFADRPSLREIYLGEVNTEDKSKADIFRVIAERCPHLKSIALSPDNESNICYYDYIDFSSVVVLESMKELRIYNAEFDEMEIVTICKRSPLVEALEVGLGFSSNIHLQSAALNALGSLTKLRELCLNMGLAPPSLVTDFVRGLARNSGSSLRRLHLDREMPLPTAAIEALANGCPQLRDVEFWVCVGEAEPASIRFLIDCIVAHPSWIPQTGEPTLLIYIWVIHHDGDEAEAGLAAFEALAAPAANLPAGVQLHIS